ncbi:MAG TPA: cytochrome c3 family protein [Terriglobales bacterium]
MKTLLRFAWLVVLLRFAAPAAAQQVTGDVLGMHDLSQVSGASLYTSGTLSCTFCHAPHSGLGNVTPLWNQTLSKSSYMMYRSSTYHEQSTQPPLGITSSLCLSCHDGTVAVGQSAVYGQIPMTGNWNPVDNFGTTLTGTHPFSLQTPMKDAANLVASLVSRGKTADPTGAVKLINGNIECTSCHDPHVQGIDKVAQEFLVRDSSNAQMCLACHDPNRVMQGQVNPLAGWNNSIHRTATNQVAPDAHVGPYGTVTANACSSCHMSHDAISPARLLRPANPPQIGMDPVSQSCITCHAGGTFVSPAAPNIQSEMVKTGHPLPAGNNGHDAAEPVLLANNRHTTCADCHNVHNSAQTTVFSPPPLLRPSQAGVNGISATDGITPLIPAANQYENCLRCHGSGPGKQRQLIYGYAPLRVVSAPDRLNVIPEFATSAASSHPVTHISNSSLPQPSLLTNMLNENGTQSGRLVGSQIFCSDCHNSDDNREFGGQGPNGPHGSAWTHILERRYEFSQAPGPGQMIINLYPSPDLSVNGPYALCGKCHDLTNQIMKNTSWSQHYLHINAGFTCSTCHTAHGVGGTNPNIGGQRLVNFDANVVAPNGAMPISYNQGANTCALVCHETAHNPNGSVSQQATGTKGKPKGK